MPSGAFSRRAEASQRGAQRALDVVVSRPRYTAKHILTAELLAGFGIVALRAVADYEPQADGTLRGKVGHPKGQYGPLPILAGLIGTFFLLSFLAARGGTKGKVAVVGGGLIVLVLGMKSTTEIAKVGNTFTSFGKAKVPPGAWQTTGTAAGTPISGTLPAASSGSGGGSHQPASKGSGMWAGGVKPVNGSCPTGYVLYTGPGAPKGGICTPLLSM